MCYVWQLKVHRNRRGQANDRTIEQGTVLKGFRNKSRFTKRRELYRMLPIYEKANRIFRGSDAIVSLIC